MIIRPILQNAIILYDRNCFVDSASMLDDMIDGLEKSMFRFVKQYFLFKFNIFCNSNNMIEFYIVISWLIIKNVYENLLCWLGDECKNWVMTK